MGIGLMVLAIVVVCYALSIYFRRLYLLQHGKSDGYTDHVGPVVFL
jgi:preprotein translocase subunit SecG